MKTNYIRITLKEAQRSLDDFCTAVASNRDVVIIKRPNGCDVALVAASEFSSLVETLYLLSSHTNASRLLAALKRARRRRRRD